MVADVDVRRRRACRVVELDPLGVEVAGRVVAGRLGPSRGSRCRRGSCAPMRRRRRPRVSRPHRSCSAARPRPGCSPARACPRRSRRSRCRRWPDRRCSRLEGCRRRSPPSAGTRPPKPRTVAAGSGLPVERTAIVGPVISVVVRFALAAPPGRNSVTQPGHAHGIADGHRRRRRREDEEALGGRVGSASGVGSCM